MKLNKDNLKKAGFPCSECGYMLLADELNNIVYCEFCKKEVIPK